MVGRIRIRRDSKKATFTKNDKEQENGGEPYYLRLKGT